MSGIIEENIEHILGDIIQDYGKGRVIDKTDIYNQPDKNEIIKILNHLL